MHSSLRNRFGVLLKIAVQALIVFSALRIALVATYWNAIPHNVGGLLWAFWTGLRMDVAVVAILAAPMILYCALMPNRIFENRWHLRILRVIYTAAPAT